ncbi:MAG: hypothetical protein CML37_00130 [Rhodobacteraceae bacterium]|nr:hypothetical protein [Paracoccaceae bacterium]
MKRFANSKDTGAPCQRCMILRVFIGMVLLIVILGLLGGDELAYLKYITVQNIGNLIVVGGLVMFLVKIIFWYWDKKQDRV